MFIRECFRKLFDKDNDNKNLKYRDLTPENNITNGKEYFEQLDWALSNTNVNNIALTGPYGAGKSSVIESYFSQRKNFKPIFISLASFNSRKREMLVQGDDSKTSSAMTKETDDLVKGFLQQLFYKVNYKKIPQSRYRKLHKVTVGNIFLKLFCMLGLVLAIICVIKGEYVRDVFSLMTEWGKEFGIGPVISFIFSSVTFGLTLFVASAVVKWAITHIGNAEINIADKAKFSTDKSNEDTVFNKYLDEIVYFFEETDYDVVILEDIDRYDNTDIFIKLRELNLLLNGNESVSQHVIFIYALKDDFFETYTERTKFFDFIISVIPYINATNSDNLLRRRLEEIKKAGIDVDIEDNYITKVSPFISDMRVLTSIFNDFVLYKNTLNKDKELKLSDEQMLSLMIYKNLCPQDFADIESERGVIKDSFKAKQKLVKLKSEELQEEVDTLKNRIDGSMEGHYDSVEEFKVMLLYKMSQRNGMVTNLQTSNGSFRFQEILQDDFDMTLIFNSDRIAASYVGANGSGSTTITNIDDYVDEDKTVLEIWEELKLLDAEARKDAQQKVEELKNEIYELKALKIKEMISEYGIDFLSDDDDFADNNRLLIFFLRNGYIDETYVNYINYFHPDSITVDEQRFILNVRNYEGKQDFEFEISHKKRLVDRLVAHEFRQEEVLNFSLVEYLMSSQMELEKQNEFLRLIGSRTDSVKEFIQRYLQKYDVNSNEFIYKAARTNPFIWGDLLRDESIPRETKIRYFDLLITYADEESIRSMDEYDDRSVSRFIESTKDIFEKITLCPKNKILTIIDESDIKILNWNSSEVDSELCELIYGKSKYEINASMLEQYVLWKKPELIEQYKHAKYTTLLDIADDAVLEYIRSDFNEYLKKVFLTNENNHESELAIATACKYCVDVENMIAVIDSQETEINNVANILEQFDDTDMIHGVIDHVINTGKCEITWNNILAYHNTFGMTEELLLYIQNNIERLCMLEDRLTDDFVELLLTENWPREAFRLFVRKYKLDLFSVSISDVPRENVIVLLEEHYIPYEVDIYEGIRSSHESLCLKYILNHYDEFFENLDSIGVDNIPYDEIIESDEFRENEKLVIITLRSADMMTEAMAMTVRDTTLPVEKEYVMAAWNILEKNKKYQLLLNHLDVWDNKELPKLFGELDREYQDFAKRTRHKVSLYRTEFNESLMKALKKRGYLSSCDFEYREKTVFDPVPRKVKEEYVYGWVREIKNA